MTEENTYIKFPSRMNICLYSKPHNVFPSRTRHPIKTVIFIFHLITTFSYHSQCYIMTQKYKIQKYKSM